MNDEQKPQTEGALTPRTMPCYNPSMRNAREILDTAPERLLTVVEFANLIGQHSQSVRRNIARGKIEVTYWKSSVGISRQQAENYVKDWYEGDRPAMMSKVAGAY